MASKLEEKFIDLWINLHPRIELEREIKAIPGRRFRFDFGHLESKVLIEINGGTFVKSKHSSGKGINRNYEKNNLATLLGFRVFMLSSSMINSYWLNAIAVAIDGGLPSILENLE